MSGFVAPTIKKKSAWQFDTFGSGGASVVISISGGKVVLTNPHGKSVDFWYGGLGAGWSFGIKAGKFKIKLRRSGAGGPTDFPSTGILYILDNLEKDDFSKADLQGPCAFIDAGVGLIGGGSGTAMLIGLDVKYLPMLSNPVFSQVFMNSAKGLLLMAGINVGVQAGGGVSGLVGWLH